MEEKIPPQKKLKKKKSRHKLKLKNAKRKIFSRKVTMTPSKNIISEKERPIPFNKRLDSPTLRKSKLHFERVRYLEREKILIEEKIKKGMLKYNFKKKRNKGYQSAYSKFMDRLLKEKRAKRSKQSREMKRNLNTGPKYLLKKNFYNFMKEKEVLHIKNQTLACRLNQEKNKAIINRENKNRSTCFNFEGFGN